MCVLFSGFKLSVSSFLTVSLQAFDVLSFAQVCSLLFIRVDGLFASAVEPFTEHCAVSEDQVRSTVCLHDLRVTCFCALTSVKNERN